MYLPKSFAWQTSRNRLQLSRTEKKMSRPGLSFLQLIPTIKKGPMANCLIKWLIELF